MANNINWLEIINFKNSTFYESIKTDHEKMDAAHITIPFSKMRSDNSNPHKLKAIYSMMDSEERKRRGSIEISSEKTAALVERAKTGDNQSLGELIGIFQAEIFRMIFYRIRSRMDAEDLTQEVFLRAYKKIHQLQDASSFRSWLFGIAVNCVRDFHRKRKLFILFEDDDKAGKEEQFDGDVALKNLLKKEFWKRITKLSFRFSGREREVFFLRFMDHLSIREITQALGKNESTIKTHLYRAIKKFKEDEETMRMIEGGI